MAKSAKKTDANIGFEKQIWDAACVLRGNMDASEYKNVVLGLIFLKYISDRLEDKYQELKAEGDGFEEDVDENDVFILGSVHTTPQGTCRIPNLFFKANVGSNLFSHCPFPPTRYLFPE